MPGITVLFTSPCWTPLFKDPARPGVKVLTCSTFTVGREMSNRACSGTASRCRGVLIPPALPCQPSKAPLKDENYNGTSRGRQASVRKQWNQEYKWKHP